MTELTAAEEASLQVRADSLIALHRLVIRPEDGEYVVGRSETGVFAAMPEEGAQIIRRLQREPALDRLEALIAEEEDAEVDLQAFVEDLVELGFVRAIDGRPLNGDKPEGSHLAFLNPGHLAWLFSRPAQAVVLALVLSASLSLALRPDLLPRPRDFVWGSPTSLVLAVNSVWLLFNLILHEVAHLAAARSLGVSARIGLDTRLHNLVMKTDVSGLWAVDRRLRYRVYLAGMVWDLIPLASAILLRTLVPLPGTLDGALAAIAYINLVGILWQFQIFMRTDIYYLFMDLLRARRLYEDAISHVRYGIVTGWRRLRGNAELDGIPDPASELEAGERRAVIVYAWVLLVGSTAAVALFAAYTLPLIFGLILQGVSSVVEGLPQGVTWEVLDGAITALLAGGSQALFLITLLRKHGPRLADGLRARTQRRQGSVPKTTN